jgi:histidinol-phosphate aminotransferase
MHDRVRPCVAAMTGYVPGEQPLGDDFIKLNTNENPYPPSPRVIAAIQGCLIADRLRKYPDPTARQFREAAARQHGIDPDWIMVGNGSDEILTMLTRVFVPEGGLIVSMSPSYILFKSLAEIQGARFQEVPFDRQWDLPHPWPAPGAQLIFLTNPNSPSGTMVNPQHLQSWAESLKCPLVLDEAYVDFADLNGLDLARQGLAIVTRSLSKSYSLAGLRFGYAIAKPAVIRELLKVKDSYNCDVLSQAAATAALEDQDYFRETRAKVLATRAKMTSQLIQLGFETCPSQANFLWCRRLDRPVKPIFLELKCRQILVRYMNYPDYGDGLRISVGSDPEIERLFAELHRLL